MPADENGARKRCFVISPIGEDSSPERVNADWVLKKIIEPTLGAAPFDYDVARGDSGGPGPITSQVINAIMDADLIVADLTGRNANVFYELAIAHMAEKKVITMITRGEPLPFDTKDYRTIFYDRHTVEGLDKVIAELTDMAKAVSAKDFTVSNPVTSARGNFQLTSSADPRDKIIADNQAVIGRVESIIDRMEFRIRELEKQGSNVSSISIHGASPTGGLGYFGISPTAVLGLSSPTGGLGYFGISPTSGLGISPLPEPISTVGGVTPDTTPAAATAVEGASVADDENSEN